MLCCTEELREFRILATDGDFGRINDCELDNWEWMILYFEVDAGDSAQGRPLFLSPIILDEPDWGGRIFPARFSKVELNNLAHIETEQATEDAGSRQAGQTPPSALQGKTVEAPPHGQGLRGGPSDPVSKPSKEALNDAPAGDFHLHRTREVIGYGVQASDGLMGEVEDLLVRVEAWRVEYIIARFQKRPADARAVFIPLDQVHETNWTTGTIHLLQRPGDIEKSGEDYEGAVVFDHVSETTRRKYLLHV